MLVRALYLSVDPYMRGRISPARNYAAGVQVGQVMTGGGVGRIVSSNLPGFAPGEIVESFGFGWQEYALLGAEGTRKVDPQQGPIQSALGYLGLPGLTAYFALLEVGRPRAGETVVISAAAGGGRSDRGPDREARRGARGRDREQRGQARLVPRARLRRRDQLPHRGGSRAPP